MTVCGCCEELYNNDGEINNNKKKCLECCRICGVYNKIYIKNNCNSRVKVIIKPTNRVFRNEESGEIGQNVMRYSRRQEIIKPKKNETQIQVMLPGEHNDYYSTTLNVSLTLEIEFNEEEWKLYRQNVIIGRYTFMIPIPPNARESCFN
jgi:hypothetical protein